jgi:transcriptional regulator GlxA family with amidase domain
MLRTLAPGLNISPFAAAAAVAAGLLVVSVSAIAAEKPPARSAAKTPPRNVAIVLYEGVELLDFAGPAEVFKSAAGYGGGAEPAFRVYTVAATRAPLKSLGFVTITPEFTIEDAPAPDVVVFPGGSSGALTDNAKVMAWATRVMKESEVTMTVCTGAFVPAKAGMLDGLTATTWYGAIEGLRREAPKANVQDGRRFVDNGHILTTAGVSAGIDGALHLVARLLGRAAADRTARYMEYHWTPEPYLAQRYAYLNPTLDDAGRAMQQAALLEDARDYEGAARAWRALTDADPANGFAWFRMGSALLSLKQFDNAVAASTRAAEFAEVRGRALYNIACARALQGRPDDALEALARAVDAGFRQRWALEGDEDLASIRSTPRFQEILAKI